MKPTLAEYAAKTEIVARMGRLTPASPRQWGKMTVDQMVCHAIDAKLMAMGERTVADKSNIFTKNFVRLMALRAPMQWPHGIKTVPEFDQAAGAGTPPALFEADRAQLIAVVERFAASKRDFMFAPHPMFGQMSEWEWMRWGYLHADHHLRQFGL